MTEKVKVTQAQFEWLEKYKSEVEIDYAINIQPLNKRPDSPIADWSVSKVAKALLIGYEVKEKYSEGDWVVMNGHTLKIMRIQYENKRVQYHEVSNWQPIAGIERHATSEEIKSKKERQKWSEIKVGDVLRFLPMAHEMGIYQGDADDEYIIVENSVGRYQWPKAQVELYAKKVGEPND